MQNNSLKDIILGDCFLVDVRKKEEFADGHVEGSINIPLDWLMINLDQFEDKNNIVVFCQSGNRSGAAQGLLETKGFKNVYNGGTWFDVKYVLEEGK